MKFKTIIYIAIFLATSSGAQAIYGDACTKTSLATQKYTLTKIKSSSRVDYETVELMLVLTNCVEDSKGLVGETIGRDVFLVWNAQDKYKFLIKKPNISIAFLNAENDLITGSYRIEESFLEKRSVKLKLNSQNFGPLSSAKEFTSSRQFSLSTDLNGYAKTVYRVEMK